MSDLDEFKSHKSREESERYRCTCNFLTSKEFKSTKVNLAIVKPIISGLVSIIETTKPEEIICSVYKTTGAETLEYLNAKQWLKSPELKMSKVFLVIWDLHDLLRQQLFYAEVAQETKDLISTYESFLTAKKWLEKYSELDHAQPK